MAETKKPRIETGFRIGKLTVVAPTDQRKNGYTIWNCMCDCGGFIELDTRTLQRGTVRDCGCETKVKPGRKDLTGQRFGRLVCLKPSEERDRQGATQWICKCDCGKECLAATHQLLCGYKKSCGCLSHPPLKNYVGKRFGMLTVLEYAGKRDGMHRWRCLCDCGKESIVGQTLLQSGKTKSCGCNGYPPMEDLTGRFFGRLTVLEQAEWKNGTSYWRCRCECGNETTVRYAYLITGHTKSCGCLQRGAILDNLRLVDGTSVTKLEAMRNRTISSNTSGYTGVYRQKNSGKWAAQITFKNKTYYLGAYDNIDDAIKARKRGEEMHDDFLEWYYETHSRRKKTEEKANQDS